MFTLGEWLRWNYSEVRKSQSPFRISLFIRTGLHTEKDALLTSLLCMPYFFRIEAQLESGDFIVGVFTVVEEVFIQTSELIIHKDTMKTKKRTQKFLAGCLRDTLQLIHIPFALEHCRCTEVFFRNALHTFLT